MQRKNIKKAFDDKLAYRHKDLYFSIHMLWVLDLCL